MQKKEKKSRLLDPYMMPPATKCAQSRLLITQDISQTYRSTQKSLHSQRNYLVVDNCLRIVKDKLPVIAVDEAQEGHQGHGGFGLKRCELWQRYMAIPVNFA